MEGLSLEGLRSIFNKIKDVATCPICWELARPPVCLCDNGHLICSSCKGATIVNCPTCRTSFSPMIPVDLNNILNAMPRSCDNSAQGCDHYSDSSSGDHKLWCKYRVVPCKMNDCEWIGSYDDIMTHLQTEHSDEITFENQTVSCPYQNDKSSHFIYPILVNESLLWEHFKVDNEKNKLFIMLQCCPSDSEQLNSIYTYELKGLTSNIGFKYTQKVCKESDNVEEWFAKELCMAVPLSIVDVFFVNELGLFSCVFNISKYQPNALSA